ncbi:hypothetical protein GCM10010411_26440 [Actinomadura fulvescens]|uniref:Uncharacterized protein n=1 Tax=Actinomadura fulvescens TaxID=46160 RepID=A0ABN3PMZ8_9ACTN
MNEDVPGFMNSPGRRPVCESWDATRLLPSTMAPAPPDELTGADVYDPTVPTTATACRVIPTAISRWRTRSALPRPTR